MTALNCESVRLAAMAIADGEKPELQQAQVEVHLSECADCRQEIEQLTAFAKLLDLQKRREFSEEIWPRIEQQLNPETTRKRSITWRHFLLLGLLLFDYRAIQLMPGYDFGLWFSIVPALLIIAAFKYFGENPFKINPALRLEGE